MVNMISKDQQLALLKYQATNRLTRIELGKRIGISQGTLRTVLDGTTPVIITNRTFQAVNELLIKCLVNGG